MDLPEPPAHEPVLRREVVEVLSPAGRNVVVDCTVGAGGHAAALLRSAGPRARLVGMDVDEANLRLARRNLDEFASQVRLFQANFAQVDEVLEQAEMDSVDILIADLGLASTQLDDPERGLSFQVDGPLDMRLDRRLTRTAADLVNGRSERDLADLIYEYGEERYSRRIARAIVAERKRRRIGRTLELSRIIERAVPAPAKRGRHGVHPATRTFQALRIAVNDELSCLDKLLKLLPKILTPGGRAAIISFHSLEDRRVKQAFADWAAAGGARILTKKPQTATEEEIVRNPRSRSAKLRGIERMAR